MNIINDIIEVSLIRINRLSILSISNKRINILIINLDLFVDLFNEFIHTIFWSLKSDILLKRYLLYLRYLIIRMNGNHLPLLLIYKYKFDNNRFLLLPHPSYHSQFYLFPSTFIFNYNRKIIRDLDYLLNDDDLSRDPYILIIIFYSYFNHLI
jgi:hypothetical protein